MNLPIISAKSLIALSVAFLLDHGFAQAQDATIRPGRERRQVRRTSAREEYPELTRKLLNPLARVLTIPTSFEYLEGAGIEEIGQTFTTRIAPRVPFVLNNDWHLISKTDLAWSTQKNVIGSTEQEGLTDFIQTLFFSPDRSLGWGIYWGVGPTFVLPTATDDFLGTDKFSIGPSAAVYKQAKQWTTGVLFNHVWSVAGSDDANYVSSSRIEPMIAYTAPTATTIAVGAEINRNWQNNSWLVPVELRVSQLTMIFNAPVQWSIGGKHYFSDVDSAPDWGTFFQVTIPLDQSH